MWFEQHSTGSQIAPAFAGASFCGFFEVHLRLCPNFINVSYGACFSEMMLRVVVLFTFLSVVPCQTSSPVLPLRSSEGNHHLRRCMF